MRRITVLIMIALFVAPLAGCLADDDGGVDPGDGSQDGTGADGNETDDETGGGGGIGGGGAGGGNLTGGNETGGNVTGEENATWTYDNRTGDVSGINLAPIIPVDAEETFDVVEGTQELAIDMGVEGDDLDIELRPPDCTEADCAETTGTAAAEGGNFTASVAAPASGTWTVYIAAADLGPTDSTYSLSIATLSGAMAGGNNTTF